MGLWKPFLIQKSERNMDFELELSREAEIEFNTIDCFFGAIGIVEKFHSDFHFQMMQIKENPFLFQVRYKDIRIAHLKHFKYSIHFQVINKNITVLRILSQHQTY